MTSVSARPESSNESAGSQGELRAKAEATMATIAGAARQATDEAKRSAATLASEANEKVKSLVGQQVGVGADLVGHVAASAKKAADDLDRNAPQLAGLVRDASDRMERFSRDIQGQSFDELLRRTKAFARERPAVVFGAAATCGFLLFRLLKAGSPGGPGSHASTPTGDWQSRPSTGVRQYRESPPISPTNGQSHGA
jgi:ElaB/YqjD/DUF883 family membrane-anchored ribosome-binding protein